MTNKCCPNCKGFKFSVEIQGFQTYYSDSGDYYDIDVDNVTEKEKPFCCSNCFKEYAYSELENIKEELTK